MCTNYKRMYTTDDAIDVTGDLLPAHTSFPLTTPSLPPTTASFPLPNAPSRNQSRQQDTTTMKRHEERMNRKDGMRTRYAANVFIFIFLTTD